MIQHNGCDVDIVTSLPNITLKKVYSLNSDFKYSDDSYLNTFVFRRLEKLVKKDLTVPKIEYVVEVTEPSVLTHHVNWQPVVSKLDVSR